MMIWLWKERLRNKLKSKYVKISIAVFVLVLIAVVILVLRANEDNWITDEKGVYVPHGAPDETPDKVIMQEDALGCATQLYADLKSSGIKIDSQCLGGCFEYAVDIVHVPRIANDSKTENQCPAYFNGEVKKFIELDKKGEVVRVV